MTDHASFAFRRMRRSERILDLHSKAGDTDRAWGAYETVLSDSDTFEIAHPTTSRGVIIKAKEAIVALESGEDEAGGEVAAKMIRHFFRTRKIVDDAWLRDLRYHVETISMMMAPTNDYALSCLRSILVGMGRPRLAWSHEASL